MILQTQELVEVNKLRQGPPPPRPTIEKKKKKNNLSVLVTSK